LASSSHAKGTGLCMMMCAEAPATNAKRAEVLVNIVLASVWWNWDWCWISLVLLSDLATEGDMGKIERATARQWKVTYCMKEGLR
jgi:hypothetical protein